MIRLYIIFGSQPTEYWHDGNMKDFTESIQDGSGAISTKDFNTEEEKNAYIRALNDLDGWDDYALLDEKEYLKLDTTNL